jgi:hypothetical protein
MMLEAETSSSSKNPKHYQGEESIPDSETEDAETEDLPDKRSSSPHSNMYDTPGFLPEDLNSPVISDASDSDSEGQRVTIEEVENINTLGQSSGEGDSEMLEEGSDTGFEFIEDYLAEAGMPGPRRMKTPFEILKKAQQDENKEPWSPFANEEEWELAKWLMTAGVSQARMDEFLKLSIVSEIVQTHLYCESVTAQCSCDSQKTRERTKPSYHNKRTLLEKIDALPDVPGWTCEIFEITGDQIDIRDANSERKLTEEMELWCRDPIDCIKELIGNPAFKKHMQFKPERVFTDGQRKNEKFDNMWTCKWWWDLQVRITAA